MNNCKPSPCYSFYRGNVVNALQHSIESVSSNLVMAYQKMAQNMESNIKMMSNMNKMMEAVLLQNLDMSCFLILLFIIVPTVSKDNSRLVISIVVRNESAFELHNLRVVLHYQQGNLNNYMYCMSILPIE